MVIFNKNLADVAEKYLRKGAKVYLEGSLQTRKWTDKDGAEKYSTEVVLQNFNGTLVMLDGRGEGGGGRANGSAPAKRRQPSSATRWMTRFRSSLFGLLFLAGCATSSGMPVRAASLKPISLPPISRFTAAGRCPMPRARPWQSRPASPSPMAIIAIWWRLRP